MTITIQDLLDEGWEMRLSCQGDCHRTVAPNSLHKAPPKGRSMTITSIQERAVCKKCGAPMRISLHLKSEELERRITKWKFGRTRRWGMPPGD
ncbi:MAG: hypothetical protein AAGE80_05520 [Pseudomonadota bacterium]